LQFTVERDGLWGTIHCSVPLCIGKRRGEYYFEGTIDEVRIYDGCLDGEQVARLCESSLPSLARIPSERRSPDEQALLATVHRVRDESFLKLESQLAAAETSLRDARWHGVQPWYVNSQGQTMVVFRQPTEPQRIDHSFAISNHEVTVAEFRRFRAGHRINQDTAPTDDCPVHGLTWYAAAEYCSWLSQQDGIPKDQWVYEPHVQKGYAEGMKIKQNFLELRGYRLPTQVEWEHACRAGTSGTYGFGEPIALLKRYGHYARNSSGRSHPVASLLPNAAGMFDMHGNLREWAQDPESGSMSPVRGAISRVLRGGSFRYLSSTVRSATRGQYLPGDGSGIIVGFRPTKTYHLSPKG
jgi:formylglycine-generating enzyme required for sulfatase activity